MNYQELFFREDEKPLENLLPDGGFCGIFRTIGCIGDSLASGEFQTPKADGTSRFTDMYEYSWGQYIARTIGSKVYNFSKGGMTAKDYMEKFAKAQAFWNPELACQAYIIALGTNDAREKLCPMGELSDVSADEKDFTDTFAGHYCALIRKLKQIQPNAKFFLMTLQKTDNPEIEPKRELQAQLIYKIAETFDNCYVMDFREYAPPLDRAYHAKFSLNGHRNALGYIFFGKMVMSYMDYIIRHNIKEFDMVGFIGKESILETM